MIEDIRIPTSGQLNDAGSCCNNEGCSASESPISRTEPKVGRNDPCPCGNGRKFKKCCGQYV
jgi:hypothetical protein